MADDKNEEMNADRIELQKDGKWAVYYQGDKQDQTHVTEGSAKNALHSLRVQAKAEKDGTAPARPSVRKRTAATPADPMGVGMPSSRSSTRRDDD